MSQFLLLDGFASVTDGVGKGSASLSISTTGTGDPYSSIEIANAGNASTTTGRYGITIGVTGGTQENIGVDITVSPTLGNNIGVNVLNGSNPTTPKNVQYGGTFVVNGAIPTADGVKYGLFASVTRDAKENYGIYADASAANLSSFGGYLKVSGASGARNYAAYIENAAGNPSTAGEDQYGALITVNGVGSTSLTNKYGISVGITGDSRNAIAILAGASGGASINYAVYTTEGSSIFNASSNTNTDFRVQGTTDANLISVDASANAVGVGVSGPTQKLDVRGAIQNIHNPNTHLSTDGAYGDVVTFGTSSGALTAGRVYYLNSSLVWTLTDANAAASATGMIAIALGTAVSNGMLVRGYARNTAYTSTDGQILYLSTSSGAMTATANSLPTIKPVFMGSLGTLDATATATVIPPTPPEPVAPGYGSNRPYPAPPLRQPKVEPAPQPPTPVIVETPPARPVRMPATITATTSALSPAFSISVQAQVEWSILEDEAELLLLL